MASGIQARVFMIRKFFASKILFKLIDWISHKFNSGFFSLFSLDSNNSIIILTRRRAVRERQSWSSEKLKCLRSLTCNTIDDYGFISGGHSARFKAFIIKETDSIYFNPNSRAPDVRRTEVRQVRQNRHDPKVHGMIYTTRYSFPSFVSCSAVGVSKPT